MKKLMLILVVLSSLLLIGASSVLAVVQVKFDPSVTYVGMGGTFNIAVTADIPTTDALTGWGFNLLYDPSQVRLNGVAAAPEWDLIPTSTLEDMTALLFADPNSPPAGLAGNDVLLVTLNLTCLSLGTSYINIAVDPQDLLKGFSRLDGTYADWTANPSVIVQALPEPSTLILCGLGLAGCIAYRIRKPRPY
jgi:hypothetical protein